MLKERAIHAELDARKDRELLTDLERLLIRKAVQETDERQLVGKPEPMMVFWLIFLSLR